MKIAILGGTGQLGTELRIVLDELRIDYVTPTRTEISQFMDAGGIDHLTGCEDCSAIINTIAFHKPLEKCENNLPYTFDVNVNFVHELACYCARNNKVFIHISTDHVYRNDCNDVSEAATLKPHGIYSLTKLWAEQIIQHQSKVSNLDYIIFRVSSLHGRKGNNFLETVYNKLIKQIVTDERAPIEIYDDQTTCFTFAFDAAKAIIAAYCTLNCERIKAGLNYKKFKIEHIYNCANKGSISFYDLAVYAMKDRGLNTDNIQRGKFNDKIRAQYTGMNMGHLDGIYQMPHWRDAVHQYNDITKELGLWQ